ncbi:MAG TPA: T9SS type A sorting domain-containing protein [Bacteroidales bacterium]|nr:T9SS type A sorting domain-containing protein [Bacteroidales bacterium]
METLAHARRVALFITGLVLFPGNAILYATTEPNSRPASVADEPELDDIESSDLLYETGSGRVEITSTLTVDDEDDRYLRSATIRFTSGYNLFQDVLRFNNKDGISGTWNQLTGVLTLIGRSTVSNYQKALRSIQYENTNTSDPSETTRTVSFRVFDGEDNSNTLSRNIVIFTTSKVPRLSNIESSRIIYCLNSGAVSVTSNLRVTGAESPDLVSAKIAITSGYSQNEDYLRFTNQSGITGSWEPSTGVLSLSGEAPVATYQNALRSIRFENINSIDPDAGTRVITFTVSDNNGESNPVNRSIFVNGRVSGILSGSVSTCNNEIDDVPLGIDFTGTAPWEFVLIRNGGNDVTYRNITQDPYTFFVSQAGTYRIKSISDANCVGDTTGSGYARVAVKTAPTAVISGVDTICSSETAELRVTLTGTAPWSITYLRNGLNPTVVNNIISANFMLGVTATGTYTLSHVADASCNGNVSGTGIVRQYTQPTAVISGNASVCEHSLANLNVTLTGIPPWRFSYKHNTNDPVEVLNVSSTPRILSVYQGGTYTLVTVHDKNCNGSVSGSASVTIRPAPEVSITGLAAAYSVTTFKVPVFGNPAGGVWGSHPALIDPPPADTMFFFPIVAGLGTHYIVYSYQSPTTFCHGFDTAVVNVLTSTAAINFENDRKNYCTNDLPFVIEGVNLDDATGSFSISGGVGLVDNHDNTATVYPSLLSPDVYTITYSYFSGSPQSVQSSFEVSNMPVTDFTWDNACFYQGQPVAFTNTSGSSSGFITMYRWKIFTGTGYDSLLTRDITYTFPEPGNYDLQLQIATSDGCTGSVTKSIGMKPVFLLKEEDYFEDFEDRPEAWKIENASSSSVNSWELGSPVKGFSGPSTGENCWYTEIPTGNAPEEQSWVTSPCFDFTGTQKPMIKLDIWRLFDDVRDGAVLQASDNSGKTWQNVGQLLDGINWFNQYNILGEPGDQKIGWSDIRDTRWMESRHSLDELRNKKNIQFRVAYGSDGTARNTDGIAFDNFGIGERNRTVLAEHFTNSSDEDSKIANTILNDIANADTVNVIDLQYHTSFPGEDPFNTQEPYSPDTRLIYYGLSAVPFTLINGGFKSSQRFDYELRPPDENTIHIESLNDSKFQINLNSQVNGNILNVEVEAYALESIPLSELTIHVAVIERKITGVTGNNGETVFESVVKKLLPNAAGTTSYKTWEPGEPYRITTEWDMQNINNIQELRIAAFIQDELTREIHQAALDTIGVISGINDFSPGKLHETGFAIYPNPASKLAKVKFRSPVSENIRIELYNSLGSLVYTGTMLKNTDETEIPVEDFPYGVYMIRMIGGEGLVGNGKLTVTE